jgi:hypothetical protein
MKIKGIQLRIASNRIWLNEQDITGVCRDISLSLPMRGVQTATIEFIVENLEYGDGAVANDEPKVDPSGHLTYSLNLDAQSITNVVKADLLDGIRAVKLSKGL